MIEMTAGRKSHAIGCEHGARTTSRAEEEEPCLSSSQARELGSHLRGSEEVVGGPAEIEWSLDEGGFKLLQARPLHMEAPRAADQHWDQHQRVQECGAIRRRRARRVKVRIRSSPRRRVPYPTALRPGGP